MEFQDYRSVLLNTQVLVDAKRKEKMKISIDVSFPEMPCFLISLDVMDVSGDHQNDVESSITKTRLSLIGDDLGPFAPEDHVKKIERPEGYCGSCYGAEKSELLQGRQNVCCQTCGEVRSLLALTGTDSPPIDQIQQVFAMIIHAVCRRRMGQEYYESFKRRMQIKRQFAGEQSSRECSFCSGHWI